MDKPSKTSQLLDLIEDEELREKIDIIDEVPMNFRYRGMILSYTDTALGNLTHDRDLQPHIHFGKEISSIRHEDPQQLLSNALELVDEYIENQE